MLIESGRGSETLDEPLPNLSYISVFITHFLNSPAENYGTLKKLYLDLDLSLRDIVLLTVSQWPKTSILEALKLHGIEKKNIKKLRAKYGEQIVKGGLKPDLKEQRVIKR